jgi:Na+/melibiose symporter-like transporter
MNSKTKSQDERIKLPIMLAFVGPSLPFAALGLPLAVTISDYYANAMGLSLVSVGIVFMAVRFLDIFCEPLIGLGMDSTKIKFGRFKLWILMCLPVLLLGTGLLFLAPKGVGPIYLGAVLLLTYVGYSMAALSHSGWGSVLHDDYHERTRVFAFWQAANIVGILLIISVPVFVMNYGGRSHQDSVRIMGLVIMALLPIMIALALFFVPEKTDSYNQRHNVQLSDYMIILKQIDVRRVLISDFFLGLAPGIMGALFFFYFIHIKQLTREECNLAMLAYFVGGLIGAPIWSIVSTKIGKDKGLILASMVFALIYGILWVIPEKSVTSAIIACFFAGIPYAATLLLTRSMMADIGDEILLVNGTDNKGALMAILSATTKMGYAVSIAIMAFLQWVGFDHQSQANSTSALIWLKSMTILMPVGFLIIGAAALRGYSLTSSRHEEIRIALKDQARG